MAKHKKKEVLPCPVLHDHLECSYMQAGYRHICGVDEAGAGPLAGRVYAAAVILPAGVTLPYLNDSKQVTKRRREVLFPQIQHAALAYSIAWVDEREIDVLNILNARMLAMERAICGLSIPADFALIDGDKNRNISCPSVPVVGGDAKSVSIAAASILAKVARDRYMIEMAEVYPQYAFEKHKGYPTTLHYKRLREFGACPIHRQSFLKKFYKREGIAPPELP